jgi:hypothetical protein
MIRREYLTKIKKRDKPHSMVDYELERIRKEDDENYIIENYRPLKEGDIKSLSKPTLDHFVDKLLVNPKQVRFLFNTTAKSEINLVKKVNGLYLKNTNKDKKTISVNGPKDLRKMREKYEVINQVKNEVENNKRLQQDENFRKTKLNEEFFRKLKTNPCLSESNMEKDKISENRLRKVFFNIETKINRIKLPGVKLDNNDVFSRLYHNAVFVNDRSYSNSLTSGTKRDEKSMKVKNVIESSTGKEFSIKITDDLVAKCYSKHTGGPFFKNIVNTVNNVFSL